MRVPSKERDCCVCGHKADHIGSYVFWCPNCGAMDDCCTIQTPRLIKKLGLPDGAKMLTPETIQEIME